MAETKVCANAQTPDTGFSLCISLSRQLACAEMRLEGTQLTRVVSIQTCSNNPFFRIQAAPSAGVYLSRSVAS